MGLLLPLVLCTLATWGMVVASPPQQPLSLSPLLSRGCNDSDVLAVAGFALQDINSNRKDGYVLSLNRVSNVQEHRQASDSPYLGAGVCISWGGQSESGNPETHVGRKPAEDPLLPSARVSYMLLLLLGRSAVNSILI